MGKKITMQDIADAAHVSKSAVSFAYNTPDRLSSETVEHIFSVAKELGYVRNPVAYMLRTQKTVWLLWALIKHGILLRKRSWTAGRRNIRLLTVRVSC